MYAAMYAGLLLSLSFSLLNLYYSSWVCEPGREHGTSVYIPQHVGLPWVLTPLRGQGLLLFLTMALVSGTQHGPSELGPGLKCMQVPTCKSQQVAMRGGWECLGTQCRGTRPGSEADLSS